MYHTRDIFLVLVLLSIYYIPSSVASKAFAANQTTVDFPTVWMGIGENKPVNGSICSIYSPACEPVWNATCDHSRPAIAIVTQPACQYNKMVINIQNSDICDRNKVCKKGSEFIAAILIQNVIKQEIGYYATAKWTKTDGEAKIPTFEVAIADMGEVYKLARYRPTLQLSDSTNQWKEVYSHGAFIFFQIVSAIIALGCMLYIIVSLGSYFMQGGNWRAMRVIYLSFDFVGNLFRLIESIGPLTSRPAPLWAANQFIIAFCVGFTYISIMLVPLHIFPVLTKKMQISKTVKRVIIGIYVVCCGVVGVFTMIRPSTIVTYRDKNVRDWASYLSFSGILFSAVVYTIIVIWDIARLFSVKKTLTDRNKAVARSLAQIAVVMSVTSVLLFTYAFISLGAILKKAFLHPEPLAGVTLSQLIILGLISVSHLVLFRIDKAAFKSTKSQSSVDMKSSRSPQLDS